MQGNDQQAYDRGITIFSPDGRLYQVEYAREAVEQGAPAVGVRADDGVVLAAHAPRRSSLIEDRSIEKLHSIDDHVTVASAGHAADARRLVDIIRRAAQGERLRYGEPATVETLATTVADHIQEHTQTGGARPYGTALLVAGYDETPQLFEVDPSGAIDEWRADAVGRGTSDLVAHLEEHHEPAMTTDDALGLAIEALATTVDDLTADDIDAGIIGQDGYTAVPTDRIGTWFDESA
ncbi:MAG: archaeal proteasome endopeptidase complex subunit alpha [Halobacteriales archaeon]